MHDVEALPTERGRERPDVADVMQRAAAGGEEGPGPSERQESGGERAFADEPELRLDSRGDEGGGLVEDDRCGSGPLFAGDELQDAHEKKLSVFAPVFRSEAKESLTNDREIPRPCGPRDEREAVDLPPMSVDPELLAILVCPKTKGPLELVDLTDETRRALVEKYREKFRDEEPVVSQGLYSKEANLVYPIISDIPVMLIDEALPGDVRRRA